MDRLSLLIMVNHCDVLPKRECDLKTNKFTKNSLKIYCKQFWKQFATLYFQKNTTSYTNSVQT